MSEVHTNTVSTRESEVQRTNQRTIERESEAVETCPECGGHLVSDEEHGETTCTDCGLVVDADQIDHGPEWRAFDDGERSGRSRVGAPTTKLMHDDGLSTKIDWQNKDAYGKTLSSRQRQKMQRLRTWDERFRAKDHQERNLKQALGEIDRMGSALGLSDEVRETASVIYRQALENDLLPGRSIEAIATASVYAAGRQMNSPRSIDEVAAVSRVDEMEFKRAYRYVVKELNLPVKPADPLQYLGRLSSQLAVGTETERLARDILQVAGDTDVFSGKSPVGLAAAALYAAARLSGTELTQDDVSEVADVSTVTIRNRYQELLDVYGDAQH